ncbi:Nrf-6_1 protein [Gryllus bimaculatus]|nr:Nrf-6_1 protein [Gryllus bimaculatus]
MNNGVTRDDILVGVCVPAACTHGDVQQFLADVFASERNVSLEAVQVRVDEDMCQTQEPFELDWLDAVFIAIICVLCTMLAVSSTYDVMRARCKKQKDPEEKSLWHKIILTFSLPYNFKRLFEFEPSTDGLDCLYGIKSIAMLLIINAHSMMYVLGGPISNTDFLQWFVQQPLSAILNSNMLYVETFLFTGAFLLALHFLKQLSKNTSVNLIQSWYLAADTQLFAAALVLLWALGQRRRARLWALLALLAVSVGGCFVDALLRRHDPTILMRPKDVEDLPTDDAFVNAYIKTHLRATSYICGLLLGHWLHDFLESGRKFSKIKAYVSDAVLTYVAALVLSLLIDSPMQALSGLLAGRGRGTKEELNTIQNGTKFIDNVATK